MIFGHRQEFAGASAHYIVGKVTMAKEKTVFFVRNVVVSPQSGLDSAQHAMSGIRWWKHLLMASGEGLL